MATASDVVILGGGSGGYACALRAAQLGMTVTLIEEDRLGGTCLHSGCIPTKALLHSAAVARTVAEAARFGVSADLRGFDQAAMQHRKDAIVARLYRGLTGLVAGRGVTVVPGTGRLTGPATVEVDGTPYTGEAVVLATGSSPGTLPGIAIDGVRVITSDHALDLAELPRRVVILGGGVIGCEFATLWGSFGVEVTIVEAAPRLLPGEEEFVSRALARAFAGRDVRVVTDAGATDVEVDADADGVTVSLAGGEVVEGDLLLVAVGRHPRTGGIGLTEVGIELAAGPGGRPGHVVVDERLRTSVTSVRAVGDIVAGPQLAHRGFAQGIFVAEDLAGLAPPPPDDAVVPRVAYTHPEVAAVGLTEAQARETYGEAVESFTYDLAGNGRSQILGAAGAVTVIRRREGPVLGIHMVGDGVSEMIGEALLIHGWEAHPEDVAPLLHAHPTQHEAIGEAHLALAGKPLHTNR